MSKWNLDPEVIPLACGDYIEVHHANRITMTRQPDGTTAQGDPLHVDASVRVFLRGEDGFFAFTLSPEQARALAASVDRHCPDAEIDDRLTVRLPGRVITRPETVTFGREWAEVLDGLQARLGSFGGVNDDAWASVEFRLTPPGGQHD